MSKDYIKQNKRVRKFQEGGAAPAPQAPQGGNPQEEIMMGAMQASQSRDPELALQVCDAIAEMAGGAEGGAPPPQGPPAGGPPPPQMAKKGINMRGRRFASRGSLQK